jgi:hypothetical protein
MLSLMGLVFLWSNIGFICECKLKHAIKSLCNFVDKPEFWMNTDRLCTDIRRTDSNSGAISAYGS